jgi:folylpolyglutamate synthase/dihydropteroate synthase
VEIEPDLVNHNAASDPDLKAQKEMMSEWVRLTGCSSETVSIQPTLQEATDQMKKENVPAVLVTGSLHLIGGTMTLFEMPVA